MASVVIRQSGGANIVSIPKAIVRTLGLHVGSKLKLSIENSNIVLTPIKQKVSLKELLDGSPKSCFEITSEDRQWLGAKLVGNEI